MKDKELKIEDIEAPHTLGGALYTFFLYREVKEEEQQQQPRWRQQQGTTRGVGVKSFVEV